MPIIHGGGGGAPNDVEDIAETTVEIGGGGGGGGSDKHKDRDRKGKKDSPTFRPRDLPGVEGKDYHFIRYKGTIYVVYKVEVAGKTIRMAWRVPDRFVKAFKPRRVVDVSRAEFRNIQTMGTVDEIRRTGDNRHPFRKFLDRLQEIYGPVPWMRDRSFMEILLQGWVERWSAEQIAEALKRSRWYKTHTEWQRNWATMKAADRNALIQDLMSQMRTTLDELFGPLAPWTKYISQEELRKSAEKIASGAYGTSPDSAFRIWSESMRIKARGIEGTAAYREYHAALNEPEDMFERLRQDAFSWLGPAMLDAGTLMRWSNDLVSGKRSEADWASFIRRQAHNLYPFLGPEETWQDRASAYKQVAERVLGRPISWTHPILQEIGVKDEKGNYTGATRSLWDFELAVRQLPEFWSSRTAAEEGYALASYLMDVFLGVR